jgi:hypothetical protein
LGTKYLVVLYAGSALLLVKDESTRIVNGALIGVLVGQSASPSGVWLFPGLTNLGFLLRAKLAAVLIIPSSWGSQLDGEKPSTPRRITRLRFFAGKLLSKWEGPFVIEEVYRSGAIKIASLKDNTTQVVNGQRLKHYIARDSYNEDVDVIQTVTPEEFIQDNM